MERNGEGARESHVIKFKNLFEIHLIDKIRITRTQGHHIYLYKLELYNIPYFLNSGYSRALADKEGSYVTLDAFHRSHESPNVQSRKLKKRKKKRKRERKTDIESEKESER